MPVVAISFLYVVESKDNDVDDGLRTNQVLFKCDNGAQYMHVDLHVPVTTAVLQITHRLCLHDSRVELNPGWDLSYVYKRRVGIKREEFNKPFPYNFLKKDPANVRYTAT